MQVLTHTLCLSKDAIKKNRKPSRFPYGSYFESKQEKEHIPFIIKNKSIIMSNVEDLRESAYGRLNNDLPFYCTIVTSINLFIKVELKNGKIVRDLIQISKTKMVILCVKFLGMFH